nr:unnamed protein product [Digitaria exilis]
MSRADVDCTGGIAKRGSRGSGRTNRREGSRFAGSRATVPERSPGPAGRAAVVCTPCGPVTRGRKQGSPSAAVAVVIGRLYGRDAASPGAAIAERNRRPAAAHREDFWSPSLGGSAAVRRARTLGCCADERKGQGRFANC